MMMFLLHPQFLLTTQESNEERGRETKAQSLSRGGVKRFLKKKRRNNFSKISKTLNSSCEHVFSKDTTNKHIRKLHARFAAGRVISNNNKKK